MALSLIDLDHFMSFNDRFGHAVGDHALTAVAATLAANLRPTDLVARMGGEEFVIICPDTELDAAALAAEQMRAAVAAQALVMPDGIALPAVTISVGVARRVARQSAPELLEAADRALRQAKQAGRNRVVLAK